MHSNHARINKTVEISMELYGFYLMSFITSIKMVQLTTEHRVSIVTNFIRKQSVTEVQNAFRIRFPDRNSPVRKTILDNVRKYQNTSTSLNRNQGNSGGEEREEVRGA